MNLLQDLRFALRSLRARAGTTLFAVLTLAAGLAATLAIACVIDRVLLRAPPYPAADRLVTLREVADNGHRMALATPNYTDLASTLTQFETTTFYNADTGTVRSGEQTLRVGVNNSGGDFFRTLGIAPQLGSSFAAGTHEHVAVIGDGLWRGLLHGRGDVLGQTIQVEGERYSIVGVMPPDFAFPQDSQVWIPFLDDPGSSRSAHNWEALGRLRSDARLDQAQLSANGLAVQLRQRYGRETDAAGFALTALGDALAAPFRDALLLLGAGTAFLLLIAVSNTTNLLLALNGARSRELAVRAALGASTWRLVRQVALETLLIALAAVLLGALGAAFGLHWLLRDGAASLPRVHEIRLDGASLLLGAAMTLAIATIVSAAVWWSNRRSSPIGVLRESGRGHSPGRGQLRARAGLLIAQTTLTTLLLVGAGLLGRSFLALLAVDPGFAADGAVSVQLAQPWTRDSAVAVDNARRYDALMQAFAQLPGVSAVGGVSSLPLTRAGANGGFWDASVTSFASTPPSPLGMAEFRVAGGDYFRAAGIPLLRGRSFDATDRADGEHVAIVSAATARATWGERDPLGQRIQFGNMDGDTHLLTVIGVVGDVHERALEQAPEGVVYVDIAQRPLAAAEFNIVVRSSLDNAASAAALRTTLAQLAGGIPYTVVPLSEVRSAALADRHFALLLLGAFAAIALLLAIGGLYGLMAFAVGQREHEFALRQALGSSPRRIVQLVLGSGLRIGAAGIGLGLVLALLGAGALHGLLYGVPGSDPLTLLAVSALLLSTLLLACALPARQACTIAPREALL